MSKYERYKYKFDPRSFIIIVMPILTMIHVAFFAETYFSLEKEVGAHFLHVKIYMYVLKEYTLSRFGRVTSECHQAWAKTCAKASRLDRLGQSKSISIVVLSEGIYASKISFLKRSTSPQ